MSTQLTTMHKYNRKSYGAKLVATILSQTKDTSPDRAISTIKEPRSQKMKQRTGDLTTSNKKPKREVLELTDSEEDQVLDKQELCDEEEESAEVAKELLRLRSPFEVTDLIPQFNKRQSSAVSPSAKAAIKEIRDIRKAEVGLEVSPPNSPPSPYRGIILEMSLFQSK